MDASDLTDLSVSEASRRIADGDLTPSALLEAYLRRIAATDDAVHAWVSVDEAGARATARERTEEARAGHRRGSLHGIPVAIKDIFHVAGMTTTCGAAPAFHTAATADATSVARLRAAGSLGPGKGHTTEVAYFEPRPTRNPSNPAHTPGCSSPRPSASLGCP